MSRVNAEWVNGELSGAKGMFPTDFVDEVPDGLPEAAKEGPSTSKDVEVWIQLVNGTIPDSPIQLKPVYCIVCYIHWIFRGSLRNLLLCYTKSITIRK